MGASTGIDVASTASSKLQITHGSGSITSAFYSTVNAVGPAGILALGHGRGSATGLLQNGDVMGQIRFAGADGTDLETVGAQISAEVDGTPGANDMPSRLVFSTTADGASGPTERMRLLSGGGLTFNGDTAQANALGDYEEGTWSSSVSGVVASTNIVSGKYTKIGNAVFITGTVYIAGYSSGSGNAYITLPFAPLNTTATQYGLQMTRNTMNTLYKWVAPYNGGANAFFYSSAFGAMPGSVVTNGNIDFNGTYLTNT